MPVFESVRKVQVFGSSLAMTLPSMFVKACEIEKGCVVNVLYGLEGVLVAYSVEEPEALMERLLEIMGRLEEKINDQNEKKAEESSIIEDGKG